ncbi:hypothetical protein A2715_06040 [Candidatus Woesebacteria bacterium RIFCSPHIGHO2_01_FULL_39_32]|uniref:Phage holin family protein n=2 Tax=Candidatus Woeseibacteriota TaxID=1752722 RepID=A0A0G0SY61_9BACT|nr:MAG: hypothetical protein UT61_C0005G0033 [Candidatus Woesebacteria bacterium GW2011_GWA1_39_8]OGM05375.1 MAG: hypothetical protein A2124_00210 [Candidatus Woesebacteria bacterium GWB1_37_5]OGM25577.1 MAG: hypothetical protein A2715_06040 [Candidatus Woesebacteria bacterium RIFCSPHIGHO2_01_FULL_39_32]OGM36856.1 MAG: hypothetical protein A3F01_00515 [Candidatus Woesebacteria bacterium RIFCSPHIGHO2_12_FULL_38_11]OGM65108.1 MAG: hypothetical protein A2893_05650 [Candidatus Woesebacteria bacteri
MKRILRHYIIDTFSLWVISQTSQGLVFQQGFKSLFIAGVGLMAVSLLAKPIINMLLIPLNLITFGLFRWVSSAVVLYIVTLLVKDFKVVAFNFVGFSNKWIEIPSMYFQGFWAYVAFAFLLSIITSFIYWVIK